MLLCSAAYHFIDLTRAVWDFTTDDAFISLRYARHWAEGNGLRWNIAGAPVEGYSNFLYVALAAAVLRLGLDPVVFLKLLGCGAAIATAFLLYIGARAFVRPLPAAIPGVIYLACPATQWWAVSGLETTTFVAVAVTAWVAFSRRWMILAGFLVAIAGLLRPDGPVIGVAFVLVLLVAPRRNAKSGLLLALGFLPLYAPYFAWRLAYYGYLLPNSVACKSSHAGSPWSLIFDYLPVGAILIAIAIKGWRRWSDPAILSCFAINALYMFVLYGADTAIGYGIRHFMTAFALLTIPAAVGVDSLFKRGLLPAVGLHTVLVGALVLTNLEETLEAQARGYADRGGRRAAVARWLRATLPPGSRYVMGDVGVSGYLTPELAIVDAYCINNEAMGRATRNRRNAALVEAVLADPPAAIVVSTKSSEALVSRSEAFTMLLEHREIARRYDHVATFGSDGDEFNYWIFERSS